MMIRVAKDSDVNSIVKIYNYYVSETVATFEEEKLLPKDMLARIAKVRSTNLPWIVAEDEENNIIGYAYASQWKERHCYRFSVEVTVYLSPDNISKGVGSQLYEALFSDLKSKSIRVAIGGITLPNPASVALHEKFGMKQVAHFKEVGFKFNQWLDTGYWQKTLD